MDQTNSIRVTVSEYRKDRARYLDLARTMTVVIVDEDGKRRRTLAYASASCCCKEGDS